MWPITGLLLGVFLTVLPRRWRARLPLEQAIPWERAAILSGLLESFLALLALIVWYSHTVTHWAANTFDSALRGGPEAQVPGQAIGFSALVLWCMHPLTWFISYFAIEGVMRFLSAISAEQILPSWPLAIADWGFGKFTHRPPEGDSQFLPSGKEQVKSLVSAARQAAIVASTGEIVDELAEFAEGPDSILEIRSSRPKPGWDPPRVVRIADTYYRLEFAGPGMRPRPFVFRLRRLAVGVPGRNVLLYQSPLAPESNKPA